MRGELLEAERVHSIVGGFYDVYNYFGSGCSYLRATAFEVGLLLHFGPKPSFERYIDYPKRRRG